MDTEKTGLVLEKFIRFRRGLWVDVLPSDWTDMHWSDSHW